MTHQVTRDDYLRCVDDGGCPAVDKASLPPPNRPMVGVSWQDAHAYAGWLSRKSGRRYRLPTDAEWAFAAGSRFRDEGWPDFDNADPAKRWLAQYDREAQEEVDAAPRAIGSFGGNEKGLLDVAGNVWEWTDTCFVRIALDAAIAKLPKPGIAACGWSKGAIAPTSPISSATRAPAAVRSELRPRISASDWCGTKAPLFDDAR